MMQAVLDNLLANPVSSENNYYMHKRYLIEIEDAKEAIKARIRYEASANYHRSVFSTGW